MTKMVQETFHAQGLDIAVQSTGTEDDYISLTDLAKAKTDIPSDAIANWMRLKDTITFLGVWEKTHNPNFNSLEFDRIESEAGRNAFTISPRKWVQATDAIGIRTKAGRYAATFAHVDIAMSFATWISPEFRLYVFQEYRRLKEDENSRLNLDWQQKRLFSAMSYRIHTDAVKEAMAPNLSKRMQGITYAKEAEMLNLAVFGITSKQWRAENPDKCVGGLNMRDYASTQQNLILFTLEGMNAQLIRQGLDMNARYQQLWEAARNMEKSLKGLDGGSAGRQITKGDAMRDVE